MTPQTFTGERLLPSEHGIIEVEHLHRYALALDLCPNARVLDIACGEGYGANLLAQVAAHVIGIDIDAGTITCASEKYHRPNLTFAVGDCAAVPLPDATLDRIVSFETIEHVHDQPRVIAEYKRLLAPGGILLISTPNRDAYDAQLAKPNPFHTHELTLDEFRTLLQQHFAHVIILEQRAELFSILQSPGSTTQRSYIGSYDAITAANNFPPPVYYVAIASNSPLPPVATSLFTGAAARKAEIDNLLASLRAMQTQFDEANIARNHADHRANHLQGVLDNVATQIHTLEREKTALQHELSNVQQRLTTLDQSHTTLLQTQESFRTTRWYRIGQSLAKIPGLRALFGIRTL